MSSFTDRCNEAGIKITVKAGSKDIPEDMRNMNAWTVTLRFNRRSLTTAFFTGHGWNREPNAADVLSCLLMDAESIAYHGSFEAWARDMGYDEDSRRAERVYKACEETRAKLLRFLGDKYSSFETAAHEH